MRNPDRIPQMLHMLGLAWAANPDMRLTQLVANAANQGGWSGTDNFHCEDDMTLTGLIQFAQGDAR